MATSHTTSLRLSDELRGRYETLAQITGRSRNGLMIEAEVFR
jgi:predicted DNA-binding protein